MHLLLTLIRNLVMDVAEAEEEAVEVDLLDLVVRQA